MEFSEHCGENLLRMIVKEIDQMLPNYDSDDDILPVLLECSQLGHRLLEHDYFYGLEDITDKVGTALKLNNLSTMKDTLDEWTAAYNRCLRIKREDYNKFFLSIANNIEDFC